MHQGAARRAPRMLQSGDGLGRFAVRGWSFSGWMMSIWKLRVGAENYYLSQVANGVEDYYTGRGELPGRWLGTAATGLGLGLGDTVDRRRPARGPRRAAAGHRAVTERRPARRCSRAGCPGFDLTFAAPKSVSVLYALGDPLVESEVVAAHDSAVDDGRWRGWSGRPVSCVAGRTTGPRRPARRPTSGPAACPAPGSSPPGSGTAPAAPATRICTPTSWSPTSPAAPTDAGRRSTPRASTGPSTPPAPCSAPPSRHELTEQLGVAWRPAGKGLIEIAGVPAEVLPRSRSDARRSKRRWPPPAAKAPPQPPTPCWPPAPRKAELDPATIAATTWAAEAAAVGFDTAADRRPRSPAATHLPDDDGTLVVPARRTRSPVRSSNVEVRSGEFAGVGW